MKSFAYIAIVLPMVSAIAINSSPKIDQTLDESLDKRWDVPGLNCGSTRAMSCAQQATGALADCIYATISGAMDIQQNMGCMNAIKNYMGNVPKDCAICLGEPVRG